MNQNFKIETLPNPIPLMLAIGYNSMSKLGITEIFVGLERWKTIIYLDNRCVRTNACT